MSRHLFLLLTLCANILCSHAFAFDRRALLIANQTYNDKVGPLKNPVNDARRIKSVLEKLGFKVTLVENTNFSALYKAVAEYARDLGAAAPNTVSIVYYSGHGAADQRTKLNYLIPVDVSDATDESLWNNSIELKTDVLDKLIQLAPEAIHYVIFDACRNELLLKRGGKRTFEVDGKSFVPIQDPGKMLVAFSTAPKQTASDGGEDGGPYAIAFADEIARSGIEMETIFINIQRRVFQSTGQNPFLSGSTLPAVYLSLAPSSSPRGSDLGPGFGAISQADAFERDKDAERGKMKSLLKQVSDEGVPIGGNFFPQRKWTKMPITFCFMGGDSKVTRAIAIVGRQWNSLWEYRFRLWKLGQSPRVLREFEVGRANRLRTRTGELVIHWHRQSPRLPEFADAQYRHYRPLCRRNRTRNLQPEDIA